MPGAGRALVGHVLTHAVLWQVVYPFEEKENVLALLRKHIFQNIVKVQMEVHAWNGSYKWMFIIVC